MEEYRVCTLLPNSPPPLSFAEPKVTEDPRKSLTDDGSGDPGTSRPLEHRGKRLSSFKNQDPLRPKTSSERLSSFYREPQSDK